MSKAFIEIGGHIYNLEMLVEVVEHGPQGTGGYRLRFCNGSFADFTIDAPRTNAGKLGSPERKQYEVLVATATAIRMYLFDRRIQVQPGPYRRDEDDY